MADKDKQDLVMLNIEYAVIHPVLDNVDDNVRKESTVKQETEKERLKRIADMFLARPAFGEKCEVPSERKRENDAKRKKSSNDQKDQDRLAIEYAAISPVSENAGDNLLKDVKVRQETEEERLKRIVDMFLARPAYCNDKCKIAWDVKKGDGKMTNKQIRKQIKKQNKKTEQSQEISDGIKVHKPIEAFLEEEQADDKRKRGKLLGCFGFIRVWMEKRKMKRIEKELMKKSNADANIKYLDFSDIVVKIPHSARSYEADDIY